MKRNYTDNFFITVEIYLVNRIHNTINNKYFPNYFLSTFQKMKITFTIYANEVSSTEHRVFDRNDVL